MSPNDLDLSSIPGLGPVRRKALAAAGIEDLRGLLALKVAELAEIRGIGMWQARKIREFLRQRGLLADEEEDGTGAIHVHPPHTPAEAAAVATAAQVLERQAEREAATEAEVVRLAAVVAEAMHGAADGDGQAAPAGLPAPAPRTAPPAGRAPEAAGAARAKAGEHDRNETPLGAQLAAQRERLPETATALMEAIREAAVSRRLARQITRFLVVASEFLNEERGITEEQQTVAREAMAAVDTLLNRAIERRRFRSDDQDELADRVRKYRRHLERILGDVEAGDE